MYEAQTGIKNRTGSAAQCIALAGFGGGIGTVLVRIVLRFRGLRYTILGHDGKTLSVSGDGESMGWYWVRRLGAEEASRGGRCELG